MIKFFGEEIEGHDDANIPVNIFTSKVKYKGKVKYRLSYEYFMPRKGLATEGSFLLADTKEELQEFIKKNILPTYKIAFDAVTAMSEGKRDALYYWCEKDDPEPEPSDEEVLAREGENDTEEDMVEFVDDDDDDEDAEEEDEEEG